MMHASRPPRHAAAHGFFGRFAIALAIGIAFGASFATTAKAQSVLFDFEGPYLLDPQRTIKDHSLIFDPGTDSWNVFYIRGYVGTNGTSSEKEIGHAVSDNLRSWFILPSALTSTPATFDERNAWAPEVMRNLTDDGWEMFYTGSDNLFLQRLGKATSVDLLDWTKLPANPILEPDSTVYLWSPDLDVPELSAFRDPFLIEVDGQWNLLHTALIPNESIGTGRQAVIHRSVSPDRETWTEVAPLAYNFGNNGWWRDIESVQIVEHDDVWTMFFTYFGIQAVQWIQSDSFDTGWDFAEAQQLDQGIAAEITPVGPDTWIFTRHIPQVHLSFHPLSNEIFFTLRADTLRFDPVTKEPQITPTDPLGGDWVERTGTAFIAAPTFGDNQLERGEPPIGAFGHGYLSSREFYNGPLGSAGGLGAELGMSPVGTMTSRWFSISATDSLISFRLAGTDSNACTVELIQRDAVDSLVTQVVRTISPAGNNEMTNAFWDVRDLADTECRIRIVDDDSQGYIAVDHFRIWTTLTNPTSTPPVVEAARITSVAPNPFNPRTSVEFALDRRANATLVFHDLRGRRVRTMELGSIDAGRHARVWDGTDDGGRAVASGVYLVRVVTDGTTGPGRKLTLVR